MKKFFFILLIIKLTFTASGQESPISTLEQQFENLTDVDQAETEDDSYHQQWERFRRNPLNLNTAESMVCRSLSKALPHILPMSVKKALFILIQPTILISFFRLKKQFDGFIELKG